MASNSPHVLQLLIQGNRVTIFPNIETDSSQNIEYPYLTSISYQNIRQFMKQAINLFPKYKFKALIFIFNDNPLESQKFRRGCKEFCKDNGYFCYLVSMSELPFNTALHHTKTILHENEKVIICFICNKNLTYRFYIRKKKFYQLQYVHCFKNINSQNLDSFKQTFMSTMGRFDPKKILFITAMPESIRKYSTERKLALTLKQILNSDFDARVCDKSLIEIGFNATYTNVLNAMDEYLIVSEPLMDNNFVLTYGNSELVQEKTLISLPFGKKFRVKVGSKNDLIMLKLRQGKIIETIKMEEYIGQEVEVNFKVDIDSFYSLFVEPVRTEKLTKLLGKKFKISSDVKAKIILMETHFSIWISKTEKDWKNIGKVPFIISFKDAKPMVGDKAKELQKTPFVVYDFLKLCVLENLENADPKWPFLVKPGQDKEMKIEFDTHGGRKASTVSFLMALIFRDCLSRIKKETGEKPNEIEVEANLTGNKDLIKANLEKAGERLKIKINFV